MTETTLRAAMQARWQQTDKRNDGSTSDDAVDDALRAVVSAVVDPDGLTGYYQWTGEDRIGEPWITDVVAAAKDAGAAAFEQYVVPAVVDTIIGRLGNAPTELVQHPDAKALRDDLAMLKPAHRVTITAVESDPAQEGSAIGELALNVLKFPEIDALFDAMGDAEKYIEPMMVTPFDKEVTDAAIAETRDQIVNLLTEAIRKRLPWTWEGDELYRRVPWKLEP